MTNTRNEREDITTDSIDIKRMIEEYYEQLYAHKFDNLHEIDLLSDRHNLPKFTHKKTVSKVYVYSKN